MDYEQPRWLYTSLTGITEDGRRVKLGSLTYREDMYSQLLRDGLIASARKLLEGTPYVTIELVGDINLTIQRGQANE
jgi:hypothetical protein